MSFDFKAWTDTSKLTSTTIKTLEDADLADKDALSCVTPAMLQELKLTVGQYALLCKATAKLQAGTVPVPAAAKAKAQASDDNPFLLHGPSVKPGEKPLLIPDFVDSYTQPETENEVARDGQTAIILRTSRTRPKIEDIRVPAWSAANAKIMDALIRGNKLQTRQDIADYLGYTVKVSELLSNAVYARPPLTFLEGPSYRSESFELHKILRAVRRGKFSAPAKFTPAPPTPSQSLASLDTTLPGRRLNVAQTLHKLRWSGCKRFTSGHGVAGTVSGVEAAIHVGNELWFGVGIEVSERDQNLAISTVRNGAVTSGMPLNRMRRTPLYQRLRHRYTNVRYR
ncbi:hypothetical protein Bbelb_253430 [Branchiostoma belcheri]|nr:hypothetical protein Bbelb_253430 [Branchiostoma belcheri]